MQLFRGTNKNHTGRPHAHITNISALTDLFFHTCTPSYFAKFLSVSISAYTSRSSSFSKLYISCTNLLLIPWYFVALQHQLQHFSSFIRGQSVLYLSRLYLKIHLIYLLLAAIPTHCIYLYLCGPLRN